MMNACMRSSYAERHAHKRSDFLRHKNVADDGADFHGATRHGYISAIVTGGASVKTAQELARHSTPVPTIGRYAHARLHDITGELDALPDLMATARPAAPQPQELAATGTDPVGANPEALTRTGASKRGGWNVACSELDPPEGDVPQVLRMADVGDKKAACDGMWLTGDGREAPVGVEPTVADLQSAALATWRRRPELSET
jgi:hypothetical protein